MPEIDVWQPFDLAGLRLRNRVFISAHTTNFGRADENHVTDRLVAYWRARAHGGVGLAITEGLRVHPTSLRRHGLEIFTDDSVPGLSSLVDAVHAEGSAIFAQLLHTGRHIAHDRLGAWGATSVPWGTGEQIPHVMHPIELRELAAAFGFAARRAAAAGFDGLEIHLGHGHLLQQFLSPITNTRNDAYGGSFDARLRLVREVLHETFACSGAVPVGVRVSADEFLPGGLDPGTMLEIVGRLLEEFDLAFVHVSQAAYVAGESLSTQIPDMSYPSAPFRAFPRLFKQAFSALPVLAICRIDDLGVANQLLAAGDADLVGMTRAHIADPNLLHKAAAGHTDTVRSCIACNQGCLGRVEKNLPMSCVVNPEVGLEREWEAVPLVPHERRTDVVVVGGGPAGLEAAVTAARRGHSVTVFEHAEIWGGSVDLAARLAGRQRQHLLVDELLRECHRLDVRMRSGEYVDADRIVAGGWSEVVVATGAERIADELDDGSRCFTVDDAILRPEQLGRNVAIVDELGDWAAASLAETLADAGIVVHLVSPVQAVAWNISVYSRVALLPRLVDKGVRLWAQKRPRELRGTTLVLEDTLTAAEELVEPVTSVVRVQAPVARAALLDPLVERMRHGRIHLVGDAYAPRTMLEAIYEGRLAGCSIGLDEASELRALHLRPPIAAGSVQPSVGRQS